MSDQVGTAFVGYHDIGTNRALIDWFREIIEAVGIAPKLFDFGSVKNVGAKATELIQQYDCTIFLAFRGDQLKDGKFSCPGWIQSEVGIACGLGKEVVFFAEEGVKVDGIVPYVTTHHFFDKDTAHQKVGELLKPLIELRGGAYKARLLHGPSNNFTSRCRSGIVFREL
jgi:hypothetical protein